MDDISFRNIGLFIDWIDGPFQFQMFEGIEEGAKKFGINLYCFVGGALKSPNKFERTRNFIYSYANDRFLDGLIILSTPVGNYCTSEELNQFRNYYKNIPMVSIAQDLDNAYSVKTDNYSGVKLMMEHLIKHHGYKNIAIIKGPDNNQEVLERIKAYKDSLEENGIPFNEDIAVSGAFSEKSGYEAALKLLEKGNIEAIFAINDDMAYGAIKAIKRKNLTVPNDIAVVGFDNQIQSKLFSPSITTVKMPISQLGFKAVEILRNIFNHKSAAKETVIKTELAIRESCGCVINPLTSDQGIQITNNNSGRMRSKNFLYVGLSRQNVGFSESEIYDLADNFVCSVREKNPDVLLDYFSMIINKSNLSEIEVDNLFNYFIVRKNLIINYFETQPEKSAADQNIQVISRYIYNYMKNRLNYNKTLLEREVIQHRLFGGELVSCSNMEEIISILIRELPNLWIKTFYLSLYDEELDNNTSNSYLHLIFAYKNNKRIDIAADEFFKPEETLIPAKYMDNTLRSSLIIEPLFFGNVHLGMAIFDINIEGYFYYIMRRRVLNEALNNTIFLQKVLKGSRNLEKANNELSSTLNILKETQKKLIQSEKMSAMGSLVAGFSHEINTPIGISVTAASHLDKITKDFSELYGLKNMKKSDLEKYMATAQEISGLILNNLKRAHELIGSLKQVAVDQSTEVKRKFNVKEYVDQILLSLLPTLKKTCLNIEIKCSQDLEFDSYPGTIYQILTNFIMNSITHGYDKGQKGKIVIDIAKQNNNAVIIYSDDGKGISPDIIDKIFDPFFTTRRGQGGTGLGLHIVNNLITQKLKGTVKCESIINKGTFFTVNFPLQK
ncbi:MAG: substrate-binding domain-containing protein [Brevinematales bacterium]